MITLATLPKASEQEVFEQGAKHLIAQNEKSIDNRMCLYRNDDGLMCAGGCFISDDEYDGRYEKQNWIELSRKKNFPSKHSTLIHALQRIHDLQNPEHWEKYLINFGKDRKLDIKFLK